MTHTIGKTNGAAGRAHGRGPGVGGRTLLLSSTALATLLLGSGAAGAACYSGPFPATNAGTISGICVTNTSFTGVLANTGTITTDGITVTNSQIGSGGTLGQITSSGALSGGITVDAASSITARVPNNATIDVRGPFSGGIRNAGTMSGIDGIDVINPTTFSGGISNTGSISAVIDGIFVVGNASTITGGITNSGTISFDKATGMRIIQADFSGDIVNTASGSITWTGNLPAGPGRAIWIVQTSSFSGGVINAGTISAFDGVYVDNTNVFGGTTGIVNTGTITSQHAGIFVGGDTPALPTATVTGGIRNAGLLSGGIGIVLNNVTSFSGGILNSGTISTAGFSTGISLANVGSLSGNVVNTGTIIAGNGIAVGAGVNFVGGAAIVNSGTINSSTDAISTEAATSQVNIFQNAGQILGDIRLSVQGDVLTVAGGTIAGNVIGHGANETVNFNLGASSFVYDAAYRLTNLNQLNVNSGTVVLNGTNDATHVAVNGGTLQIGDAGHAGASLTSANPVSLLGTLAGFGTVVGDVNIGAGGRLASGGATPGTLSITGSLTLASSAAYLVQFSGATASKTAISGTAALGGTLQLAGSAQAVTYVILTASSVTGSFGSLVSTVTGVRNPQIVYLGNQVEVTFDPGTVLTPGLPANPRAVATPLDNILQSGAPLPGALQTLPNLTGTDLASALPLLSGEAATGAQASAFQLMGGFLGLMSDPYGEGRGGGGAIGFASADGTLPPGVASAYAAALKAAPAKADGIAPRWSVWGSAYGSDNRLDGNAAVIGSHDLSARAAGFAAGADYRASPASTLGFALGGGSGRWSLAQGLGGGGNDAFQAGFYGRTRAGPAYVSFALAAAENWLSTSRTALAGARLAARFAAQSYGARLEGGYRFAGPIAAVTPYAALQATAFRTPGYHETDLSGTGLGLDYAGRMARDTRGEVGLRFDLVQALTPTTPIMLRGKLAYAHDWVSDPALAATFLALPTATFVVTGAAPSREAMLVSGGAEVILAGGWVLGAKFDGEFAASSRTYGGTGTLRYAW